MTFRAVTIIPTTGAPEVRTAIRSVLAQTEPTLCYLVCDGVQHADKVRAIASEFEGLPEFTVCYLPQNVGSQGFYGHRIYASFSHLVHQDYVLFLDQDNWFDDTHVESCRHAIEGTNSEWCYSLRKIVDKDGEFICFDNCESLGVFAGWQGQYHIDTNAYCVKRESLIGLASSWHGGWGQDRVFFQSLINETSHFVGTGQFTVNYRLDGNQGSVTKEFFEQGNAAMAQKYNVFPWTR